MPDTTSRHAGRWLRERQRPARASVYLAALAGTFAAVAGIVQLGGIAWVAHQVLVTGEALSQLVGVILTVLITIAVRAVAVMLQNRFSASASDQIRLALRQDLLDHFQQLGPIRLGQSSAGTLASEWLDQVEALHGYYAYFLPQMILSLTVPLVILVTVAWLDWLAAVFLLLSAPLIPLFMALVGMGAEKLNQQHMETLGRLSGHFLDRLRGLTTLQLFNYTRPATREIATATDEYRQVNMKTLRVAFLSSAVLEFFASLAIAVVAIYIGFGLLGYISYGPSAELTLFTGLFILLLAPEFYQPLRQLSQHYHDRATALGAAAQLQARMAGITPAGSPEDQTAGYVPAVVEISNAAVTFPDGRTGLTPLSLTIGREGPELVALSGPSGAGKSTLLHLIAGFQAPTTGKVRVNGGIPGVEPFGWLGQTPFIRQDTWAGNLRMVAPDASDEQLLAALENVGLAELVRQRPLGLDTPISEGGGGLSGGQARRLAAARLFLARYSLILMDEPTAGLDSGSERFLLDAINALKNRGATIIIASHHQEVLEAADRCIAINNGTLAMDRPSHA